MTHRFLGVTLVEVIFAIGVILIGLVGLLSILPLAGHRAQDAIDLNTGSTIARAVRNEIDARHWLNRNILVRVGTPTESLVEPASTTPPVPKEFVRPFCIDPMFATNAPITGSSSDTASYNASYFPFYKRDHDPLLDPSKDDSAGNSAGFRGQPRMLRVGLNSIVQLEVARALTESQDDLSVLRPKDRTLPVVLTGLRTGGSTPVPFGKSVPTGEYSWIATVDPHPSGRHASLAIVVFRNRDRLTDFPATNQTTPQGNAISERVALVQNLGGFEGGSGGSVLLMSAGNTVSEVRANDWVMLSRTVDPSNTVTKDQTASHRWYRVAGTSGEARLVTPTSNTEIDGIMIPNTTLSRTDPENQVWIQTVLLDGPDWSFAAGVPTDANNNSLTYATLVDNVVAVSEQVVSLTSF